MLCAVCSCSRGMEGGGGNGLVAQRNRMKESSRFIFASNHNRKVMIAPCTDVSAGINESLMPMSLRKVFAKIALESFRRKVSIPLSLLLSMMRISILDPPATLAAFLSAAIVWNWSYFLDKANP